VEIQAYFWSWCLPPGIPGIILSVRIFRYLLVGVSFPLVPGRSAPFLSPCKRILKVLLSSESLENMFMSHFEALHIKIY